MNEQPGRAEAEQEQEEPRHGDHFLQILVNLANRGMSFGLTIATGGLLVTGTLVSGNEYFDGFAREFASMIQGTKAKKTVDELFARFSKEWQLHREEDEAQGEVSPLPHFMHLKNARILHAGTTIPTNRGVWWRGRLDAIDGFTLGEMSKP